MRRILAALLLLALLAPAPTAAAQKAAGLLEDAEGDTHLRILVNGGPLPSPAFQNGETDGADLVGLDLEETDESFLLTLRVKSLAQTSAALQYALRFEWNDATFTLFCSRNSLGPLASSKPSCRFSGYSSDVGSLDASNLGSTWNLQEGTLTVELPKVHVLDAERRTPTRGDVLQNLYVDSRAYVTSFGFAAYVQDRMPDVDGARYKLVIGDQAQGFLRLTTADRVRVSNGGSTTFVFQADLTNDAAIEDNVKLAIGDLPKGWNATFPANVRVPAKSTVSFTLLASVPFAHEHGGHDAFNVTAKSGRDPASWASLRLGVLHTPIPQPAGHHQELYLHSLEANGGLLGQVFPYTSGSMNTLSDHEGDAPEMSATGQSSSGFYWEIPLDPALRMGLDFDLDGTGTLEGSLIGRTTGAGSVRAELLVVPYEGQTDWNGRTVYDYGESILLAKSAPVDVTLDPSAQTAFSLTLTLGPEADYVSYAPKQNLVLRLSLASDLQMFCCMGGTAPALVTEAFAMKLPLNEYHDRLTGLAEAASALELAAVGDVEKKARPGTTMTYLFDLRNPGPDADVFRVSVAGANADVAYAIPDGEIRLDAKDSKRITLVVNVPSGANEGQVYEALAFVHSQTDPTRSVVARTLTTATTAGPAAQDETDLAQAAAEAEEKGTPGPGLLVVLAALGAAGVVGRRRRVASRSETVEPDAG